MATSSLIDHLNSSFSLSLKNETALPKYFKESGHQSRKNLKAVSTGKVNSSSVVQDLGKTFQKLALSAAVGVSLFSCTSNEAMAQVFPAQNQAVGDLGVLIAGQPVKEPYALLRYALPINNKAIRDIQFPLELITQDLRVPGLKALDSVERNVRQASRVLSQNKDGILADVAPGKKEEAKVLLEKLTDGFQEFNQIIQSRNRPGVSPKQKELLRIVGDIQEDMVDKFPFEIPSEFEGRPLLKGRARIEMKLKYAENPTLKTTTFDIVVDGYNAPVTAGNFVDLVERKFYDGMEIQRADGFVVQTGDPEGPAEGFIDPKTGEQRTIPLEVMVEGENVPVYHDTLEELGLYKATTRLPFNAFGTLAMAREEFSNDSASSQVFWLLKESELTPSNANILDGRYAVFGYVVENEELLADVKVGDVIESMRVVQGLDYLLNPSYK